MVTSAENANVRHGNIETVSVVGGSAISIEYRETHRPVWWTTAVLVIVLTSPTIGSTRGRRSSSIATTTTIGIRKWGKLNKKGILPIHCVGLVAETWIHSILWIRFWFDFLWHLPAIYCNKDHKYYWMPSGFFSMFGGSGATHNKQNGCNIYFLLVGATSCPSLSNQSIMEQVDVYHIGRDKSPVVCDAIRLDANLRAWCPDCDDDGTPQHVVEHIYYFISIRIGSKVSFESGAKVHDGVYWFHCGM